MKKVNENYTDAKTIFVTELKTELKRKFKIVDTEVGDDVELKKQVLYNLLFGIVNELEKEMTGDVDLKVIDEAIDDYDNNVVDDVRGKLFNYLYNTDTNLIY